MDTNKRLRALYDLRERVSAEISGLENGSLIILEERGSLTAQVLADALDISISGASNHLHALWKAGVVERKMQPMPSGGRAFVYIRSVLPRGGGNT